jgi:hypothetical protein
MADGWLQFIAADDEAARTRLYRMRDATYRDGLLLAWARSGRDAAAPRWRGLATLPQRWTPPKFPLRAADFISRGIAEGPALGHVLAMAEEAWIAAGFPVDAQAVATLADATVARFRHDHRL